MEGLPAIQEVYSKQAIQKYGIKIYFRCDAENVYISRLKIYSGKEGKRPEVDHGGNVVRKPSKDFHGKDHSLYL